MSEEKKHEYQVRRWQDNKNRALSNKWYAIARIDLLIISISGAGIYLVFELIKYFQAQGNNEFLALKIAALLFTLAVGVNFLSQFFGQYANELEARYANIELRHLIEGSIKDDCDIRILDGRIKTWNLWVDICNYTSVTLMVSGLIVLVIYNFVNL